MTIENNYKELLTNLIRTHLPSCRIWLFGSRARQTNQPGADFDLAIDAGRILNLQEIDAIKTAIGNSNIPVFVDIVDIHNVSKEFLDHIKNEWVEWTH